MNVYTTIKKVLSETVDAVVDKTTTQAQKNRLKVVMHNEASIINEAYIELGKYFYNNLREDCSAELEAVCDRIDTAKERMSRAQQRYRDVLQEELVNKEIFKGEAQENFKNIKEPIVAKAKETADKVADITESAKEKATELKSKLPKQSYSVAEVDVTNVPQGNSDNEFDDNAAAEKIFDNAVEDAIENVIASDEDISVKEAIENAVTEAITDSLNKEIGERKAEDTTEVELTVGEIEIKSTESNDDTSDSKEYDEFEHFGVDVTPADVYGTSFEEDLSIDTVKSDTDDNEEAATETPVFVQNEEKPKKVTRFSAFSKAKRLKELMSEQNTDSTEPTD